MIRFEVKEESVRGVTSYLQQVRDRVIAAAKVGMQEAMEGLALNTVNKMDEVGIHHRTGSTASAIMRSPKTTMSGDVIRGRVSSWVGAKPMGHWLGAGTQVPAVTGKLMAFFTADGKLVFTRKHRAFSTPGRPFMNPSLNDYKAEIVAIINERMLAAVRK